MKSFSKANLISERLEDIMRPKPFWKSLLQLSRSSKIGMSVKLPHYEYFRLEMFIEDLMELTDHELNMEMVDLIAILYDDFLATLTSGTNQQELAKKLLVKRDKYLFPKQVIDDHIQITENHTRFIERVVKKKVRWVQINVSFSRKSVLRGEVLLMDLSIDLTLEEMITILLIDFATKLKEGNSASVVKSILRSIGGQ